MRFVPFRKEKLKLRLVIVQWFNSTSTMEPLKLFIHDDNSIEGKAIGLEEINVIIIPDHLVDNIIYE